MTRRVLIGLALFHFMVIILHNVVSMADGLEAVYGNSNRTEAKISVLSTLRQVIHHPAIHYYSRFSGTETGFGFFAPQVGTQYLSFFRIYDANNKLIAEYNVPLLKQQESWHRYATFLDDFQAALGKDENHLDHRYARAVLYSMGERLGLQIEKAKRIECRILAFRYPKLHSIHAKAQQNPSMAPLFENIIYLDQAHD